jgi:outer membrane protein TolC
MKLYISIILATLIHTITFGQNINLNDAVLQAINNNLDIKQSKSQIQQKESLKSGATGLLLPKVSLTGGYTWLNGNPEVNMQQFKPAIDDMAGKYGAVIAKELGLSGGTQEDIYKTIVSGLDNLPAYNLDIDFNQFPNASVNAIQPIFNGGKILNTRKLSSTQLNLAKINLESSKDLITKKVIDNYLTVLLLEKIVKYRELNLIDIQKHIQNSENLVKEGIITKHYLLKAQVELSNAERLLKTNQNRLNIARINLNKTLNFNKDTVLVLTDSLKFTLQDIDLQQLKEEAKKEQVLLQIADQKIEIAKYNLNLKKADMLPEVFAFANYSFFNSYMPVIMPPFVAGIQLHYNIFNGTTDYKKIKAAEYLNEEIAISKEKTEQSIDFLIEQTYLETEDAKYRYIKLDNTIELAKNHKKIVQRRYDEGIERSVDVVDAQLMCQSAQIEQSVALYEYYIALTNLYFTVGTPERVINLITR